MAMPAILAQLRSRHGEPERRETWAPAWERVVTLTTRLGDRAAPRRRPRHRQVLVIPNQPFFDPDDFAWVAPIEAKWKTIRPSSTTCSRYQDALPNFQDISHRPAQPHRRRPLEDVLLLRLRVPERANCARCPETTRLVERIPGMQTAMFSILAPAQAHPAAHRAVQGRAALPPRPGGPARRTTASASRWAARPRTGKRARASCSTTPTSTRRGTTPTRPASCCSSTSCARCVSR